MDFPATGVLSNSSVEVQLVFVDTALDLLLLDRPGNCASDLKFAVPLRLLTGKSLNESSTKFESHSSSATSSFYTPKKGGKSCKKILNKVKPSLHIFQNWAEFKNTGTFAFNKKGTPPLILSHNSFR